MKKLFILLSIVLFFSCSGDNSVEILNLYSGVSDINITDDGRVAFLGNLSDYENILALCYIDFSGELLDVLPIDTDRSFDANSGNVRVFRNSKYLNVLYEEWDKKIVIDSFDRNGFVKDHIFETTNSRYGSIFFIEGINRSFFIRSDKHHKIGAKRNYTYNYYILKKDLSLKWKGAISLGNLYPRALTFFNNEIYFILDDKKLFSASLIDGKQSAIYKFPKEILEIKQIGENLAVLIEDSLFMVNSGKEVFKEYKLVSKEEEYKAVSLVNNYEKGFMVHFKSYEGSTFRSFSIGGNQTGLFKVKRADLNSNVFYHENGKNEIVIYSTEDKVYLKCL